MKHCLIAVAIAVAASTSAASFEHVLAWELWVSEDRMTGEQEILGVKSFTKKPLDSLARPYQDTEGQLLIYCGGEAGFRFLEPGRPGYLRVGPELLEGDTHSYNVFPIRVRFDDEDVELLTVHTFGKTAAFFEINPEHNKSDLFSLAQDHLKVLLEVPTSEGDIYFLFGLVQLDQVYSKACG